MAINRSHIKRHRNQLNFHPNGKVKLNYSIDLQHQIRSLLLIKKHIPSSQIRDLHHIYDLAFKNFLLKNRIPKVIPKIKRQRAIINAPDTIKQMLADLEKIAEKRQQPLCVVIEEAIQEFLDLPENYLGKDEYKPGKVEKIS